MKNFQFLFITGIALSMLAISCKDDNAVEVEGDGTLGNVLLEPYATVEPFTPMSDPTEVEEDLVADGSRSQLTLGASGMDFRWEAGDFLTVYGRDMAPETCMEYGIKSFDDSGNASFNVGEFPMTIGAYYLAFGQKRKDGHTELENRDEFTLHYDGQKQIGNRDTRHLGAYDYIAAAACASANGVINFNFHHVGATLSLIFEFPLQADDKGNWPELQKYTDTKGDHSVQNIVWTKVQMYTDDNDFLQPVRTMSLRTGLPAEGVAGYAPALNTIDMTASENRNASRFMLDLRNHTDEACDNKVNDKCECGVPLMTDNGKQRLRVFMEVPPFEYAGTKRFIFRLTGYDPTNKTDGIPQAVNYYAVYDKSTPIKAGKAVQMTMKPLPTSDFDLKVKLHLDWHSKSVFNTSRAGADAGVDHIGDPGDKEGFVPPTYLYAWIFDGGNDNSLLYKKFYGPDDLDGMWSQDLNDAFIYQGDFKFKFSIDAQVEYCDVYIAASTIDLGYWLQGKSKSDYDALVSQYTVNGKLDKEDAEYIRLRDALIKGNATGGGVPTPATEIRALTFNLPASNDEIQVIRNIWSTPYTTEAGAFSGRVYNGMNVNLFHVAAKVDFQWNVAYGLNNFSLINIQKNGLKLFEPTENPDAENHTSKINNPSFATPPNSSTDWTVRNGDDTANETLTAVRVDCGEFFNKTYTMYQDITGLEAGTYIVKAQGFYRNGGYGPAASAHSGGTEALNAIFYAQAGSKAEVTTPLVSIFDGANQCPSVGVQTSEGKIPNSMEDARSYFDAGLYNNQLTVTLGSGETLRIGIRKTTAVTNDWTIFDNFQLIHQNAGVLTFTPDLSEKFNGRHVMYIPQPGPMRTALLPELEPYVGYTVLYLNTSRKDAGGNDVGMTTPIPFTTSGAQPSWFRGNVTIQ